MGTDRSAIWCMVPARGEEQTMAGFPLPKPRFRRHVIIDAEPPRVG